MAKLDCHINTSIAMLTTTYWVQNITRCRNCRENDFRRQLYRDVGLQPIRGKAGIEKGCRPVVRLSLGFILRSMT